ncbi:MAG: hypothetical protein JW944_09400, partial [Deltaproteobacteria bacterium]|nr:hypothetical protein [Deltaproteobacteria bacterium]
MKKREIMNFQSLTKVFGRMCLIFLLVAAGPSALSASSKTAATEGSSGNGPENGASGVSYSSKDVTASIAAGLYHSLFLKANGTLWTMGYNNNGQLGDGTTNSRSTQSQVAEGVAQVAAGNVHSLFIKSDGALWVTGWNRNGQLGDGTTVNRNNPVRVATDVKQAAAGVFHSLFVKTDGTLWGMGYNN